MSDTNTPNALQDCERVQLGRSDGANSAAGLVAAVFTRATEMHRGVYRVRVYLSMLHADAGGEPIIPKRGTSAARCTYRVVARRKTERLEHVIKCAREIAARINAGEIDFEAGRKEFLRN